MTERTQTSHAERRAPEGTVDEVPAGGWVASANRLWVALAVAVLGAGLTIVGPLIGVVRDQPEAGYAAMPLLIILALAAPAVAVAATLVGRRVLAAGVLFGSGFVAVGRLVVDLQFVTDALKASRPELMVPTSLAPLSASAGTWVLLTGHLAVAAAALLAAREEYDDPSRSLGHTARRILIGGAGVCVTLAAVGLLRPTFRSHDAFLLAREVIDSEGPTRFGGLLIIAMVLLGVMIAVTTSKPAISRGTVLGVFVATAGVVVPGLVAGLTGDRLSSDFGPYLTLAALAVLVLGVFLLPRTTEETAPQEPEVHLESHPLHRVAGVLGVIAGLAALGGALGTQLVVDGSDELASFANRQLYPVALLVCALGAALLVREWSTVVRPAFTVSLAAVFLVGASTLDAALTGTAISSAVHVGAGVWFTVVALVAAGAAAVLAGLAGTAERDDVDLTEQGFNTSVLVPGVAAVLLAVGAFGLPAVKAQDFTAPGIWSEFRLASWGLLLGLLVVVAVVALAPVSRPARAASLLLGSAGVVAVHLLELPLTGARAENATAGQGTWLSLACVGALIAAAVVAVTTRPAPVKR
jgi:hypothetical protein